MRTRGVVSRNDARIWWMRGLGRQLTSHVRMHFLGLFFPLLARRGSRRPKRRPILARARLRLARLLPPHPANPAKIRRPGWSRCFFPIIFIATCQRARSRSPCARRSSRLRSPSSLAASCAWGPTAPMTWRRARTGRWRGLLGARGEARAHGLETLGGVSRSAMAPCPPCSSQARGQRRVQPPPCRRQGDAARGRPQGL